MNTRELNLLESKYQGSFRWAGEINVFKHALASNGFFEDKNRVTAKRIRDGEYDNLFDLLTRRKMPTTLHCDLGCDNYDSVPVNEDPRNKISGRLPFTKRFPNPWVSNSDQK